MRINYTSMYKRKYKKYVNKHMNDEIERIDNLINAFYYCNNLKELFESSFKNSYNIEELKGDMKEYFSARINSKDRLIFRPINEYLYNYIEIYDIDLIDISDHYKEW